MMEFKFRAGDHRPQPPPPPPPPSWQHAFSRPPPLYCLSKPGFPDASLRQHTDSIITLGKPFDPNDAMHYEMELMRLREEKLLVEIERQRFLKEEARRELILFEREMAIRGVALSASYSFREQHRWGTMFGAAAPRLPSPSPSPVAVVQSFQELQTIEQLKSSDRLCFGAVALPPRAHPFMPDDKKERQVLQADKRELIVLDKPDPNVFREKRKAETPSTLTENIQPFGVKKNPQDEWSCALCQVTVSSERTFNQHLNGKKHKRKEAGLMTQKVLLSQAAPEPLPIKRRKLLEAMETFDSTGAEKKEPKVGKTLECEKTEGSFDLNAIIPNFLKLGGKEDKQQNELVSEQNLITEDGFVGKKKLKFWCKKCKVGAYASEVMFAHLNGKKHQASLEEVDENETGKSL